MAEPPSSPPGSGSNAQDLMAWYKAQYEMLESELAEYQVSSRELEQEMERDLERTEKEKRLLQEKIEALNFETDEWKRKYRESKSEAGNAQATLEKEITTLRETNRSLALKLRDSEVANDDFERQARNTTSSLEDMESKFNQAVERNVLMEEEIRIGEQEREKLRIESQRLREEMAELKIEAEVMQDKIKKLDRSRHLSTLSSDLSLIDSPTFDRAHNASPDSLSSSPLITTPPEAEAKSLSLVDEPTTTSSSSDLLDSPPSPPMSDASAPIPRLGGRTAASAASAAAESFSAGAGGTMRRPRLPSVDTNLAQRSRGIGLGVGVGIGIGIGVGVGIKPPLSTSRASMSSRAPAMAGSAFRSSTTTSRQSTMRAGKLPASTSLSHIRLLAQQMQRLEARVQSAKSKLPGPPNAATTTSTSTSTSTTTTSQISRPPSGATTDAAATPTPTSFALRSRKRTTGSTASSSATGDEATPTGQYGISHYATNHYSTPHYTSQYGTSSHGTSQFGASHNGAASRPSHMPRLSASSASGRRSTGAATPTTPTTSTTTTTRTSALSSRGNESEMSRPSSRASGSSYARPASRTDTLHPRRPASRSSTTSGNNRPDLMRPQSSLGGSLHNHSVSLGRMELEEDFKAAEFRTPGRRGTYSTIDFRSSLSGIPTPGSGIPTPGGGARRQSGIRRTSTSGVAHGGRVSTLGFRNMKLGDLGETY